MPTDCLFLRTFASRALIAAAFALALVPSQASVACSSPSGTEGEIAYNSTYHVMQFCDGSSWISMAAAATYLSETDPKVGTLTALKWCATNAGGTAIDCTLDAPLRTANNLSDLASASTARTNLGLGSIATQAASSVTITGGAIDGTAIGGTTAAAGAFTTLSASGAATLSSTLGVTGAATLSSTLNVTGTITGPGSGITALNASSLASGTVPTARLGIGTASASNFLRGDSSWAAIALSGLSDVSLASPSSNEILTYNGSAWTNAAVGSLVAGVAGPSFHVKKNADQTVTAGVATKLTWQTETFDTNNNFASDRFTPTVAGKYLISLSLHCNNGGASGYCYGFIYKNGALYAFTASGTGAGSQNNSAIVTTVVDMNGTTDYVEAYGQSTGGNMYGDGTLTFFTGSMLAPLASGVVAGTGSAGYIPYWTSGNALTYDSTSGGQFYWDSTNHRLGIGMTNPANTVGLSATSPSIGLTNTSSGRALGVGLASGYASFYTTGADDVIIGVNGLNNNIRINSTTGNIGMGTATPATTALVDMYSTTKGVLFPRMTTTQRDAISSPATGLTVYNTTTNQVNVYNGTAWGAVGGAISTSTDVTLTSVANNDILQYNSGTSKWVNTALTSAVAGAAGPSFHVNRSGSANQTVSTNTFTKIQFNNEAFDTNNNFDSTTNYRFTPTIAGKYLITLTTYCPDNSAGAQCAPGIFKNGSINYQGGNSDSTGALVSTSVILDMNGSTDYIEGFIYNGGGTTLGGNNQHTYMSGGMLAPLASGTVAGTGSAGYVPVWTSGNAITYDSTAGGQFAWDLTNHRLGIGTVAPTAKFSIQAASGAGSSTTGVQLVGDTLDMRLFAETATVGAGYIGTESAHSLRFYTGGSFGSNTRMTILSSGNVGIGTTAPSTKAILDLTSTTLGFLPPRLTTTQRDAISSPAEGLTIYNDTTNLMNIYNGTAWGAVGGGDLDSMSDVTITSATNADILQYNGSAWVNTPLVSSVAGAAGPSFFVTKNNASQTVTASTATKLTWSTEVFDTNNNFASDKFTPTVAGKYIFTASAYCTDSTVGCVTYIYKNGSLVQHGVYVPAGASGVAGVTAILDMNGSTDYAEVYVYNGGGTNIHGSTAHTTFAGSMLAPLASGTVAGTGSAGYVPVWTSGNAITYDSTAGGQFAWDLTNHRLGIGTTTPQTKLSVGAGGGAALDGNELFQFANSGTVTYGTVRSAANALYLGTQDGGSGTFLGSYSNSDLALRTAGSDRITITNAGNVGIGTATPATTALVDMYSTTKGVLFPRVTTTQRDAISSPATGLTVYNTTTNLMNVYNGTSWGAVGGGDLDSMSDVTITGAANGDIIRYNGSAWVNVGQNTAMTTTTMQANWPDAIQCNLTNPAWGPTTFYPMHMPLPNGVYYYRNVYGDATTVYDLMFNSSGAFVGYNNLTASNCDNKTITQLYAQGSAFNYIGTGAVTTFDVGSASAPGLAVTSDTNTGLWSAGADTLNFSTGGTERVRIDSSGNVGIGTASPANLLHLQKNLGILQLDTPATSQQFNLTFSSAGTLKWDLYKASDDTLRVYDRGGSADVMVFKTGGGVGIGTTSPAATALLDITSTTKGFLPPRMTTTQRDAISSPATGLSIYNTTTNQMNVYNGSTWGAVGGGALSSLSDASISSPSSGQVLAYNGSAWANTNASVVGNLVKAYVNFNGNGSTSANQTINSSYNVTSVYKNGSGDYTITFTNAMADANYAALLSGKSYTGSDTRLFMEQHDSPVRTTTQLRIYSLNGAFAPANCSPCDVAIISGNVDSSGGSLWTQAGTDAYYTTGNVGIGTATPSTLLHVNGATTLGGAVTAGSTLAVAGAITASSTITGSTGVGVGTTSVAASSVLDIVSTTKGFLPPRLTTTQRDAVSSPAEGLTVYNTTTDALNVYTGSAWGAVGGAGAIDDLSDVTISSPANSQVLAYNGSAWVNSDVGSVVAGVAGPSFMVHRNGSNQTVTAAAYTKVTWTTETFDTNNNFASSKFTPTVAGKYIFHLNVTCGGQDCEAQIRKNGTAVSQGNYSPTTQYSTAGIILDMNGSTDYVEGFVYSGSSTTLSGTANETYLTGAMLAPLTSGVVAGTGSAGYVPVWTSGNAITYDSTSGGQFYWDSTNHRLGIGTTSPAGALDVNGAVYLSNTVFLQKSSGTNRYWTGSTDAQFIDNGSGTARMTILAGGNVGIGTASPAVKLDVAGQARFTDIYLTDSVQIEGTSGRNYFRDSEGGPNLRVGAAWGMAGIYAESGDAVVGAAGGTVYLRNNVLLDSGTLRVGTTSSSGAIHVYSGSGHALYAQTDGSGAIGAFGYAPAGYGGYFNGGTAGMFATAGNGYHAYIGHPSGWALHSDNASIYIAGSYQGSDARLKEDIHGMDKSGALGKLMALRPVSFKWKPDAAQAQSQKGTQYGVIAQEAIKVLPELVTLTETPTSPQVATEKEKPSLNQKLGKTYGFEYTGLIPWLLSAMQELKKELDGLGAKTNMLVEKVTGQDEAIRKLQAANDNRDAEMKALQLENAALRKDLNDLRKAFDLFKARPRADNDNAALPRLRADNENDAYEPQPLKNASGMTAGK